MKHSRQKVSIWRKVAAWAVILGMVLFAGGGTLVSLLEARRLANLRATNFENPPLFDNINLSSDDVLTRVQIFPDQGSRHIPLGTRIDDYNSNPPTSGPHYADFAPWGFHSTQLPDERLLSNLANCGIWISYRLDISADQRSAIEEFVLARGGGKIIATPREENNVPVAIAAWRLLFEMEEFSAEKAETFTNAFIGRVGPACS